MSFLYPHMNTSSAKPNFAKKFKVASQTQLKKITNTYWRKQLPTKGVRMKGEEGELVYIKHPGVRAKVSALLRKRGYLTEKTLEKDLYKERARIDDRKKVVNALRFKFAKKEGGALTQEQILDNVKRARAVSRLMSTKGQSKAQEIERKRNPEDIKKKFKEETYARLGVHGQEYSVGISAQKLSTDDARYQNEGINKNKPISVNAGGSVQPVAIEKKSVSLSSAKENPIASGIGQQTTKEKSAGNKKLINKKTGGVTSGFMFFSPTVGKTGEQSDEKKEAIIDYQNSMSRPIIDTEFQGGVISRGKRAMHFPDATNKPITANSVNQEVSPSSAASKELVATQETVHHQKIVILFFGSPGSGKGTQSDILGKKLQLPVISTGELFRREREAKTELGLAVAEQLASGQLVADETVDKILSQRLAQSDTANGFILDGYPRNEQQLKLLQERFSRLLTKDDKVIAIYVDVSDAEVQARIGGRRVCDCGASYHLKHNPPRTEDQCDLCGRALQQRNDDQPAVVAQRLIIFHQTAKPIIEYFKNNYIYWAINGERNIEEISNEIYQKVAAVINK